MCSSDLERFFAGVCADVASLERDDVSKCWLESGRKAGDGMGRRQDGGQALHDGGRESIPDVQVG